MSADGRILTHTDEIKKTYSMLEPCLNDLDKQIYIFKVKLDSCYTVVGISEEE